MGERLSAQRPDALVVVADDHLNAFSFNCVPAMCVRIGRSVQRMGAPEEIASTALFLASDDGSYFTGQWLSPNGGLHIG